MPTMPRIALGLVIATMTLVAVSCDDDSASRTDRSSIDANDTIGRGDAIRGFSDAVLIHPDVSRRELQSGDFAVEEGSCEYERGATALKGWAIDCMSNGGLASHYRFAP